jgi:hypothetical protein
MLGKGLGNLAGMMKQAMEMRGKMEELKEQLANEIIETSSGGGMVKVTMNGKMEVLELKVDPEIIDPNDPEVLETMVRAAVNEGMRNVQELIKERMSEMTGGMDIPGLTS